MATAKERQKMALPNGVPADGEAPLDPVEEAVGLQDLGERDFLREHLAREVLRLREAVRERDQTISLLNREIGSMDGISERQPVRPSIAWGKVAEGTIGLLRKARLWKKSKVATPSEPDADETQFWGVPQRDPLVPFGPENIGKKLIAVTVFGLDRDATQKVLKTVTQYCATRDAVPVILTDSVWTEDLRESGFAFEYVASPDVQQRFLPNKDWPLYLRRRMRLFRRKWGPDGFISFGTAIPLD